MALKLYSISTLRQAATKGRVAAEVHAQVDGLVRKETRDGKPFQELTLADAEGKLTLRAWSDSPAFSICEGLAPGAFLAVTGEFSLGNFGLDAKDWKCRSLEEAEREVLMAGSPELRAKQDADFAFLRETVETVVDPRLKALTRLFFTDFGERFRRTAAARGNHHARRGGLIEHVAQMMRSALALAGVYPTVNRDLLIAGVLFHDCGKLWENVYPVDGFSQGWNERGELLGHIPIGIEVVNGMWRKVLQTEEARTWGPLQPESDQVRLHLLHLIASHHGDLQFGSPVVPKTPEAWMLHYVDNLDAKLEMMFAAYGTAKPLGSTIYEKVWPLPGNLVAPLGKFVAEEEVGTEEAEEEALGED